MSQLQTTNENIEEKEAQMGIYEVGYILVPTIAEENIGGEVSSFKDTLSNFGISFISEEFPKMIELTYEMTRSIMNKKQKFTSGYFGWVKFECGANIALVIKENLNKNEKIIRFLMIKTVRESTLSPRRSYGKPEGAKRRPVPKAEEAVPINEETIDQEIDALVV